MRWILMVGLGVALLAGAAWWGLIGQPVPISKTSHPIPTIEIGPTPLDTTAIAGWRPLNVVNFTFYLTADHHLTSTPPPAGTVQIDDDSTRTALQRSPGTLLEWVSDPVNETLLIDPLSVGSLVLSSDSPAATTRTGDLTVSDVNAWLGDDAQLQVPTDANGPDELSPASSATLAPPSGRSSEPTSRASRSLARGSRWRPSRRTRRRCARRASSAVARHKAGTRATREHTSP